MTGIVALGFGPHLDEEGKKKKKKKMRGKQKAGARLKRKNLKEAELQREKMRGRADGGSESEIDESDSNAGSDRGEGRDAFRAGDGGMARGALGRFYGKRRKTRGERTVNAEARE